MPRLTEERTIGRPRLTPEGTPRRSRLTEERPRSEFGELKTAPSRFERFISSAKESVVGPFRRDVEALKEGRQAFPGGPIVEAGLGVVETLFRSIRETTAGGLSSVGVPEREAEKVGELAQFVPLPGTKTALGLVSSASRSIPAFTARYEKAVDAIGQQILKRTPKVFRAGRGAPQAFRDTVSQRQADIANGIENAFELGSNLTRDFTAAERLRADQILRGGLITDKTPTKIVAATKAVRAELNGLQRELIELGKLKPETVERFQKNFGPYFARLFAAKEFVPTEAVIRGAGKKLRAGTPRLSTRGERIEVNLHRPKVSTPQGVEEGGTVVKIEGDTILVQAVKNPEAAGERSRALKDVLAHGFRVESREGRKITLFRDIPEEIRVAEAGVPVFRTQDATQSAIGLTRNAKTSEEVALILKEKTRIPHDQIESIQSRLELLGTEVPIRQPKAIDRILDRVGETETRITSSQIDEIIKAIGPKEPKQIGVGLGELRGEPGFVAAKAVEQISREVSINKFFKRVSDNPEWVRAGAAEGFIQMADDAKRLGDLSGKFVRGDIAAEINEFTRLAGDWERIVGRLTSLWKIGKVTNPGTISRNMMSSALIADMGGLHFYRPSGIRSYTAAAQGLLKRDTAAAFMLKEAKEAGLYRTTFNAQEINTLAEGFIRSKDPSAMMRALDGFSELAAKTRVSEVTKLYGAVDHFYKSALYLHSRRELGRGHLEALKYAKKFGIDYEDISPAARVLRRVPLGSPFITFASKIIPLSIETAVKHPFRFFKWPALIGIANEISSRQFNQDREEIAQIRDLGSLRSPRYMQLPVQDDEGRNLFLDLGYILPYGDLIEALDLLRGGTGANLNFMPPGGPAMSFLEIAFNKSMFTKREIYLESDNILEAAAKLSDHLGKALLPALTPPIPGTGFRGGYSTEAFRKAIKPEVQLPGETPISAFDFFGRRTTLTTAIASKIFGLQTKAISLQEVQLIGGIQFQSQIDELSKQLVRTQMSGITESQKEVQTGIITGKIMELTEKFLTRLGMGNLKEPEDRPQGRLRESR